MRMRSVQEAAKRGEGAGVVGPLSPQLLLRRRERRSAPAGPRCAEEPAPRPSSGSPKRTVPWTFQTPPEEARAPGPLGLKLPECHPGPSNL